MTAALTRLTAAGMALMLGLTPALAEETQTQSAEADAAQADVAQEASPASDPSAAPTAATVVATVNGTEITLGEMIIARAQLPQRYATLPPDVLFQGLLDQLVQQQLLADTLDNVPDRLVYALQNEERSLRAGEVVTALGVTAVTEDAVQSAYEALFDGAEPTTEYNASHILVETEEEAAALIEELNGGADFALLAREHSTGPSGPNGGELGWFGPGRMVPEFEAAVLALEVGEVSPPVQTQFGWHVVTLNDQRDQERPTLDQMRPDIEAQLREEALLARIAELTSLAEIDAAEPGTFDPALLTNLDLLEP